MQLLRRFRGAACARLTRHGLVCRNGISCEKSSRGRFIGSCLRSTLVGSTRTALVSRSSRIYTILTIWATNRVQHRYLRDGEYPNAGLFNVNGTLYGTTFEGGGETEGGTVFATRRPARKPCSIVSRALETANTQMRASSTSAARSMARPPPGRKRRRYGLRVIAMKRLLTSTQT
jgi:hypothetical protein